MAGSLHAGHVLQALPGVLMPAERLGDGPHLPVAHGAMQGE